MNKQLLPSKGWFVAIFCFGLHQIMQRWLGWELPLLDHYLDPLLCIPILLGIMLVEREYYFSTKRMNLVETVSLTVFLGLLFEEVFPKMSIHFTRDTYDYIAYALGGAYFWLLVNPSSYAE